MTKLEIVQDVYIEFLSKHIQNYSTYLYAHNMKVTDEVIAKGRKLRNIIERAKSESELT